MSIILVREFYEWIHFFAITCFSLRYFFLRLWKKLLFAQLIMIHILTLILAYKPVICFSSTCFHSFSPLKIYLLKIAALFMNTLCLLINRLCTMNDLIGAMETVKKCIAMEKLHISLFINIVFFWGTDINSEETNKLVLSKDIIILSTS